MIGSGDLEFSFSGLKTAVITQLKNDPDTSHPELARAFVDAIVEVLVAKCTAAIEKTALTQLVVAGGVGANEQLRAALDAQGKKRGFDVFYPEPELCTDNGAMIAFAAALRLKSGLEGFTTGSEFSVRPRWDLARA
jgi:N6-L-threonylcarbamoyladenine synthase